MMILLIITITLICDCMSMPGRKSIVAIIGGSFDPPTLAHAMIAAELLNRQIAQKVVFIPCGFRTDKQLQDGRHRLEMVNIMIRDTFPDCAQLEVNSIEVDNGKQIPTYQLLTELQKIYKKEDLYFVVGGDLIKGLRNWFQGELLVNDFNFLVVNRQTYNYDIEKLPKNHILVEGVMSELSSTDIRQKIEENKSNNTDFGIIDLVSKNVLSYIKENKLYL